MDGDRFLQQCAAGLAVLAFGGALALLLFVDIGPDSRLVEALTLLGLALLSGSLWLRSLDDGRPR